jgi:predicted nucleic acid-binding protein
MDCCSLQRPFDHKGDLRVAVESEAILNVLARCESGQHKLVSSDVLVLEAEKTPDAHRRSEILHLLTIAQETIALDEEVQRYAKELVSSGLKPFDALHLASAIISEVDVFCTCDDRFLRKAKTLNKSHTKVVSPLELVMEVEL